MPARMIPPDSPRPDPAAGRSSAAPEGGDRPAGGLLGWWRQRREQAVRVLLEDALHFLHERESQGIAATVSALAGSLGGRSGRTLRLLDEMKRRGLVSFRGDEVHLSPQGRNYALQVVRAHRLWERYFADEARMPLSRVHRAAHNAEHRFGPDALDALEAHLGHPAVDPHGDPIPSAEGEVAAVEGTPLSEWPAGKSATVLHVEDEHPTILNQILDAGLHPGRVVRVEKIGPEGVVLTDGERTFALSSMAAANVEVGPGPEAIPEAQGFRTLADLAMHERAEIADIDPQVQGFGRRRLLDLGLTPGTRIEPDLHSAFADLRAYRVRGTLVALRRDQAARIRVRAAVAGKTA